MACSCRSRPPAVSTPATIRATSARSERSRSASRVSCRPAAAVATNVTLDRTDDAGFVTAYPAGTPLPEVSTVNATRPDDTIANAAITRLSTRGTAYFSDRGTDVIVDVTGYFTGSPVAATLPVPPLNNGPSRVLLVGDSTLLAVGSYGLLHVFQGFDDVYEAASCRTLGVPSCGRNPVPNSVATINAADGRFDAVVIMAGLRRVVDDVPGQLRSGERGRPRQRGAADHLAELPRGRRVHDARRVDRQRGVREEQRRRCARRSRPAPTPTSCSPTGTGTPRRRRPGCTSDGIHLTFTGAHGVADYISRTIANLEGRPCPQPWVAGGPIDAPCPVPDDHGPPADVVSLYR